MEKIKAMFQKNYFRNVIAIVLVLPNVFIVSYGIANCIREKMRGSVMCRYLTTNELILDQMNTLYNILQARAGGQSQVYLIPPFYKKN